MANTYYLASLDRVCLSFDYLVSRMLGISRILTRRPIMEPNIRLNLAKEDYLIARHLNDCKNVFDLPGAISFLGTRPGQVKGLGQASYRAKYIRFCTVVPDQIESHMEPPMIPDLGAVDTKLYSVFTCIYVYTDESGLSMFRNLATHDLRD